MVTLRNDNVIRIQQPDMTAPDFAPVYERVKGLPELADRQAKTRVLVRVSRMAGGNFGDCKPVADGLWELRIDWGPGYRVYYAQSGKRLI